MDAKDRGQLLRMAGNIAAGMIGDYAHYSLMNIPKVSARLALETMKAVDDLIIGGQTYTREEILAAYAQGYSDGDTDCEYRRAAGRQWRHEDSVNMGRKAQAFADSLRVKP